MLIRLTFYGNVISTLAALHRSRYRRDTRTFALVLVQADNVTGNPPGNFGHPGVACASCEEIDKKIQMAQTEGVLRKEPEHAGDPVGYYVFFADPDGNTLELSFGQRMGLETISNQLSD